VGGIVRGPADQPGWQRPLLALLLLATAALYLVNLTASGYANEFYAAAVKAGTQSWKALLFGSLDAGNSITVDKPPASLWLMAISGRILGFSSFSLLLPQALMGVGTVAVVYGAVRRWSGGAAGLLAGALVAATPVAALMFRFDNPDALLTLLMAGSVYCVVRAIDSAKRGGGFGWLIAAGAIVGLGFLTKMGEALLVVPGLGLAYLVCAPVGLWLRIRNLLLAAAALAVSAGWYVALVAIWPAADRPYIGGSTTNSLLELALGYNGLGRLEGGNGNGGGGGGFGGSSGLLRMFDADFRGEISWLLPAALFALAVGLWYTRRAPRTDKIRASLLLWGGYLVVTAGVFSFMSGTIHPYYAVALAPPIGALIAIVGREMWLRRAHVGHRMLLAAMIAGTGFWSARLLEIEDSSFLSWLPVLILAVSFGASALLVVSGGWLRRAAVVAVTVGALGATSGTMVWTVATAAEPHSGSIPTSGPAGASQGGPGGAGGGFPGGGGGGFRGGGGFPGGTGGAGGGFPGGGQPPTGTGTGADNGTETGTDAGNGTGTGNGSGTGAASGSGTADATSITARLEATDTTWAAAVIGSQSAASYELTTDKAVMAIGGFTGSDDSPTLAQFEQYVREGKIAYFIAGGGMGGGFGGRGGTGAASEITQWVEQNFTATTVGGVTVYALSTATTG
jgi:4-amino-4-deoxy-L-arabinose transferase-like glycosyltransferase